MSTARIACLSLVFSLLVIVAKANEEEKVAITWGEMKEVIGQIDDSRDAILSYRFDIHRETTLYNEETSEVRKTATFDGAYIGQDGHENIATHLTRHHPDGTTEYDAERRVIVNDTEVLYWNNHNKNLRWFDHNNDPFANKDAATFVQSTRNESYADFGFRVRAMRPLTNLEGKIFDGSSYRGEFWAFKSEGQILRYELNMFYNDNGREYLASRYTIDPTKGHLITAVQTWWSDGTLNYEESVVPALHDQSGLWFPSHVEFSRTNPQGRPSEVTRISYSNVELNAEYPDSLFDLTAMNLTSDEVRRTDWISADGAVTTISEGGGTR